MRLPLVRPAIGGKDETNLYMLFTGWEVRTGKIFCRGLKNGPRPKVEGRC